MSEKNTQVQEPSERERRELQEVANRLREVGYHNAANNTERNIADIKSGVIPHAVIGAALATQQPEALAQQEREDAVLAYLDALGDDAIAHIWPDDLVKCQTSECVVEVASVRMGSPDGKTLPLFSRDQVREAIRAARSSEGGAA